LVIYTGLVLSFSRSPVGVWSDIPRFDPQKVHEQPFDLKIQTPDLSNQGKDHII